MFKPEQVKVSISRPDGGVTIMAFVTKSFRPGGDGKTDIEFTNEPTPENIEAVMTKGNHAWTSWRIISDDELPADRTFRNAWKDDGKITVDMPKAREIHRDTLRRARNPLLAALDVEFMRAVETGDTIKQTEIAAKKQVLRDVTDRPEIETAETPEELLAIKIE